MKEESNLEFIDDDKPVKNKIDKSKILSVDEDNIDFIDDDKPDKNKIFTNTQQPIIKKTVKLKKKIKEESDKEDNGKYKHTNKLKENIEPNLDFID